GLDCEQGNARLSPLDDGELTHADLSILLSSSDTDQGRPGAPNAPDGRKEILDLKLIRGRDHDAIAAARAALPQSFNELLLHPFAATDEMAAPAGAVIGKRESTRVEANARFRLNHDPIFLYRNERVEITIPLDGSHVFGQRRPKLDGRT